MSELRELYQELIIDHGRHPRNFGILTDANYVKHGLNPLCGDKLVLYLKVEQDVIQKASFTGEGCAISVASASLMTESLIGKTLIQAEQLFNDFRSMITQGRREELATKLGKLIVLGGVTEYPARVKCAILAWHTLFAALKNETGEVSTE
jgi:nitrogen fixation protein NifU and related proteins